MRTKALTIMALAAVSLHAAPQDTLLRLNFKEGDSHVYNVTMKGSNTVEIPSMGPMDMGFNGSYKQTLKFGKVDDKNVADVDMVTTEMKIELTGPMAEMAQGAGGQVPKESILKTKMNDRYRVLEMKMPSMSMGQMMSMGSTMGLQPFIELPEKAVKVGDSWDVVWPKNPFIGEQDAKLKATFQGEGSLENQTGHRIDLVGQVPVNMNLGKILEEMQKANPGAPDPTGGMGAMNMQVKGTMDVEMKAVLDKGTGRILALVSVIKSKTKMEMVDMGMTMDSSGTIEMKMNAAK